MKRKIQLMILGLCLVNGVTTGSADVVVDGQVIQATDISSISIDPINGDINVNAGGLYTVTRDGDPDAGPSVVINSLVADDPSIQEGEPFTISWVTTDADSCTPSNGAGGWSSQVITLPSGTSDPLTINTAGTYSFRLDCSNATPSSTFRSLSVTVEPTGTTSVVLLADGQEAVSVAPDATVNISWDVANADVCSTSGGNATWQAQAIVTTGGVATGSLSISVDFDTSEVFTLTCDGVADSVTVDVSTSCAMAPLAEGLSDSQISGLERTWGQLYSGAAFPNPQFASRDLKIAKGRYLAIRFETGDVNGDGDGGLQLITDTRTEGTRFAAFSECPGHFTTEEYLPDSASVCTRSFYNGGALNWDTTGLAGFRECALEPNKTYWLNITFTDGETVETDTCVGAGCYTELSTWY